MPYVTVAVEGPSDAAIAQKMCDTVGLTLARAPIVAGGKSKLDPRLRGYNNAARLSPWLILRDLDNDAACPAELRRVLIPNEAEFLVFRIPVRSIESWLLADRAAIAHYLRIRQALVPAECETLPRPKRTLVDLARQSKSRAIREDMVPASGMMAEVGPGYTGRITDFALNVWEPDRAAERNDSLERCLRRLRE
jgi:hypothetical protein